MLMIPVRYQTELTGILAIHTLGQNRFFHPKEVGMLMAICAQAGSAIRNAQLFEEIQEANAQLQYMDKLKDEFIVTASHELRTPLSAIQGYSSLLQRQHARTTPQQILRFATKISEATQQLSALVVNMTEASQLGTLDKNLQTGPVKLSTAAEVARDILSANIEQQITLRIPPDLWILCDPLRLRQVISNLFDNAAKYSPPGSHIELEANATRLSRLELPEDQLDPEQGDMDIVLVRVRDEGDGIDEEDQQKIFEKFVRASRSLTTPVRGSGLGLYICRRYIEAMGGKLWLEQSAPGAGSVFSFYLPHIDAPAETGESDEST
jgi:signal transduction histidine kinase